MFEMEAFQLNSQYKGDSDVLKIILVEMIFILVLRPS